jgi:hypothetical protein
MLEIPVALHPLVAIQEFQARHGVKLSIAAQAELSAFASNLTLAASPHRGEDSAKKLLLNSHSERWIAVSTSSVSGLPTIFLQCLMANDHEFFLM